jgi:hypothetical protein
MKKIGTIVVDDEQISIMQDEFKAGGIALQLLDSDGLPYTRFSECIPGTPLADGEFLARTRAENESLRQPMLDTGLFVDTGRRVESGFIETEVWKMVA